MVREPRFRELLAQGFQAEVVCQVDAFKKVAAWHGEWIVRAVNGDTGEEFILVVSRRAAGGPDEILVRVFKTLNGLISFFNDIGFFNIYVPLRKGGRCLQNATDGSAEESKG